MSGTVPVIDIAALYEPESLRAIDAACRRWGFFQVTNHGIEPAAMTALARAARAFFGQSTAAKRGILRTADNPWGFYDQELTKNTRDWKEVYDFGPADGMAIEPQWPDGLPGFEHAIRNYYAQCEALAFRLLAALSINLGMPAGGLEQYFRDAHTSFLRLNYYPKCPRPAKPEGLATTTEGYLGVNHHTDAGVLTVLLQDEQPGLEVFRRGRWHRVEPRDDALVVNIGDIVQVWSNDRYEASVHRVVTNIEADRYSVPYFLNPSYDTDYAPLPSMIDSRNPARYRAINWREFRSLRAAGDYADYGDEVQISQYRL